MSDYITQLRGELVDAAARRPVARPRIAPALAVIVAAVVAVGLVTWVGQERAVAPAAEQTASFLRERLAAVGLGDVEVKVQDDEVVVDDARAAPVTVPGRLRVYDWEPNLVTPGPVLPEQAARTGGLVLRDENGWFALRDEPALEPHHVAGAEAAGDQVAVELTPEGQAAFERLTREVARRGSDLALPGAQPVERSQHIAIAMDDQLLAVPYINYEEAPDGLDRLVIADLAPERARQVAAILDSGPLPQPVTVR